MSDTGLEAEGFDIIFGIIAGVVVWATIVAIVIRKSRRLK